MNKKEEILEIITELFSEKGYNASMADISKKVGIKVQSIYSHYINATIKVSHLE